MNLKNYFGFDFVKVGVAKLADDPIIVKYERKPTTVELMLELQHADFAMAEQSTYLVFVGDDLKYVGQYSGTFEERWLKRRKYIWHSDKIENRISPLLKHDNCPEISVWLSLDPYIASPRIDKPLNVNKALEQRIIEELQPEWNTVGKSKRTAGKRVKDIWAQISPA